ncbi:MAG: hypothetical protein D6806_15870 [Deltaproteobacteria bacterium]|nr:MAG: hypothetical protein D6806_15870 [Deltaproteobacteria bacterium]
MRRIMRELGRAYSKLGAAVWLTRRVVWMDAAAAAKEMSDALQRSSVRDVSMESVAEALKDVASAIEGRNRGSVKKAFASLSERCVDCHLEKRWNLR